MFAITSPAIALTDPIQTKIYSGKGIKVIKTIRNGKNLVDVSFPKWAKPKQTTDIKYRLSVLPKSSDKEYSDFFVVPSKGVIVPVIKISKTNPKYIKALSGQIIDDKGNDILTEDINKGILHYPGTVSAGELGMGRYHPHTSEFYHYKTPYATVGQAWAWLDPAKWEKSADQFYYYKKVPDGWILYTYEVSKEKRIVLKEEQRTINGKKVAVNVTSAEDQKILKWDKTKSQVAIIGCADFWTDRDRRLTVGTLIKTEKIAADDKISNFSISPISTTTTPIASKSITVSTTVSTTVVNTSTVETDLNF